MTAPDPHVVVVGGGPAGSVTALLLARRGWSVRLLDRARFPRPKACGECLNPGAVQALDRLGLLDTVMALGPSRLEGWSLRTPAGSGAGRFGGELHGLGISRLRLDAALLERAQEAGVDVREGVKVTGVDPASRDGSPPRVHLQGAQGAGDPGPSTLAPQTVVGADGLRSVVVRSLGLVVRLPRLRKVSLSAHITGGGLPSGRGLLFVGPAATVGVAPVEPHAGVPRWNVTVVTSSQGGVGPDPRRFLLGSLEAAVPGATGVALLEGPWASGPFDWPVRRCWAPGVALVGDASGYFDPFTGQGVYRALRSAELAASALDRTLRGRADRWVALEEYNRQWERETRGRRWLQRGVEAVMVRPWLRDRAIPVLSATGALDGVIRTTGDVPDPATVPGGAWR